MKYFEYGVTTYESKKAVGKFGIESNKFWEHIMDDLTRFGIQGWEVYHIIEKNDITHFLLRKEILKEDAEKKFMSKAEDTYPLGFVDHIRRD